ncbi:MAG: aminoglycoside phosphotransferase family protein [SAR202 cluster bacterium]|jgi:hypothetical protein|nr:aminoglycoside phosphotransferase family protein [SAR202 cluster bacterium]MDP6512715.1 aminoglycoside phosphotransferase family protein [SAR202 cluster bacterium]
MGINEHPRSERLGDLMGRRPITWLRIDRGYTPAERWVVGFDDGSSAFAKIGTTPDTSDWLRIEHRMYSNIDAPWLPEFLGWDDDGNAPILALEDLSGAHWPPPWERRHIESVLNALSCVRRARPPEGTPKLDEPPPAGWFDIAANPAPFLSLQLCSGAWLDKALPALLDAEKSAPVAGNDFLHLDIRSDNLCFVGDRAVIVDWNLTCIGNGLLDIAFWLPSLHAEGGPKPEVVSPESSVFAAPISGFFASRAGLPKIPSAPRVREVQLQQLRTALPWAVRALELPPLNQG